MQMSAILLLISFKFIALLSAISKPAFSICLVYVADST